jgi:UDP-glucose 4-epimerase
MCGLFLRYMDQDDLLALIEEARSRGGGLLLNVGDSPQAVVLSVDAYAALVAGKPDTLLAHEGTVQEPQNQTRPKTLFITGGAGYIGSHVVREAVANGYSVVVLDNLSRGKREYIPAGVTFIEGNVQDLSLLRDIFSQYSVDAVVHLAALLEVQESVEKPLEYLEVNTMAVGRLLLAMREAGVNRLVFSSTAAVYGHKTDAAIVETADTVPVNPYGASKLLAEQTILYFTQHAGLDATVLRFFNVAGSHPEWGIHDTHKAAHLIPIVLEVAKGERTLLTVNGGDWDTIDGTCVRDYVHVHDVARAHIAALKSMYDSNYSVGASFSRPQQETGGQASPLHSDNTNRFKIYNVGTGHGASVREVVQCAAEVTGRMIPMETGPRRPGDDNSLVADVSLIQKELGFKAQYGLEDIIESAWRRENDKNDQK